MKGIKWWLWIVALLYLMEGGGLSLFWWADPAGAAAIWAPTSPPGSLDAVAIEAISFPALFVNQAWIVLGVMLLYFTRTPAKAGMLMVLVIALELFAWVPVDLMALASGWSVSRGIALLAVHLAIAVTGILLLRANRALVPL